MAAMGAVALQLVAVGTVVVVVVVVVALLLRVVSGSIVCTGQHV